MLKVDKENVEAKGSKPLIRAELSMLIYSLHTEGMLSKEEIEKNVKDGLRAKEEITELAEKRKAELESEIKELLNKLFN